MANTSRSYPKRARQSTGSQETTSTNTYSTARRPRRSAPYSNSSGTSRATASSRNLLSQTTRGNLLIDESTLGVPCQKYTKVLRYTSSPLDIPYFGNSPNGTFKILTWVKVSELTEEERKVYYEEEKRKEEQRLIWKKELEKKSTDAAAADDDDNKEKEQSVEVEEEDENKKRKRDDNTNEGDDDTFAATGDNIKADNDETSTAENVNKSEVDIAADGDEIDINKGIVKEEDGDATMDDDNTGTNKGDETGSKSIEEQQQGEQKKEEAVAKEESEDVAAVAGEETADKSKEEEGGDASNSEAVNMDVEMNDGTNLDKEVTTSTEEMVGGDTKEEEEEKSVQETSSQ